jgi:hypothetical protein
MYKTLLRVKSLGLGCVCVHAVHIFAWLGIIVCMKVTV